MERLNCTEQLCTFLSLIMTLTIVLCPQVETDRNELHSRVTSLRNMVSNLEDQLKQTTAQLTMAKDSALELEAEVQKGQLTADQAQRTAEDMERRLNRKAGELQASEERCAQLERKKGNLSCHAGNVRRFEAWECYDWFSGLTR